MSQGWRGSSTDRGTDATPTVSVIIPCFNGERFVGEAVTSVLAQTHRDLEAIVVDDGSTDRSVAIVRALRDPRLRVVMQTNAGVAAARNTGVAAGSGEFVAFLDQDDAWLPEKLEHQVRRFEASDDVGLVYTDCLLVAEDGRPLGRWSKRRPLLRGRLFERLIVESVIPISTVLLRRTTFDAVGGFRPRFRYVEDLDLFLRVAARHGIEVVDLPLARYRLHAASTSRTLGLEVAVQEMVELCADLIAGDRGRRPAVSRALGRYLYRAGKTAFYQGRRDLAERYLAESRHHEPRGPARLFGLFMRRAPRLLLRARGLFKRLRGQAGPAPGPSPDRV